ncbi:MAG: O-antigen translocase [Muribaculaceae bacterium]|nr:O-antigen translocase [Muribaculaceae bacterium]
MSELKEENSYSNILKRLSAFGGVQIFNILIGLIRGKFVALFLGPTGMGISSLYSSSTAPLQEICSLGLNLAVVKEVAGNKDNPSSLPHILHVSIRLLLLTVVLGALVCCLGAPFLSKLTFGDGSETSAYLWLSIFVGLSIAGGGFLALLQGLGEVKRLSKASLVGGLSGLLFGIPLYYFFGDRGIVPAMIILSLATFLFYFISYRKSMSRFPKKKLSSVSETESSVCLIKRLLSLGFILLIGTLSGQLINYVINLFVRMAGSVEDVGLFQGANSITNQYVGLIMSALALDYFPRLSASCKEKGQMKEVVNRQTEIVMLVATPLIIALILTSPLIIRMLLSDKFLTVVPLMRWMGLGMLIQALAFPLGYIYVAREDRKAYVWMECVWANVCWLGCSVVFYYLYGLVGLGISLVVRGGIDIVINYIVCHKRYGFSYSNVNWKIMSVSVLLSGVAFISSFLSEVPSYSLMSGSLIISIMYSFFSLRLRLKNGLNR